jgi:hypothetical protein
MSDGDAGETNTDERRSGAQRQSRFGEMATRLDDEAAEDETAAGAADETDRGDATEDADDGRDGTAADVEVKLSRRADRGSDADGEREPSDSWEWVDAEGRDGTAAESDDKDGTGEVTDAERRSDATDAERRSDATDTERRSDATDTEPTAAGEAGRKFRGTSESEPTVATETSETELASDRNESAASGSREQKGRIWDSQTSPTETSVEPSDDGPAADIDAGSPAAEGFADASTGSGANELRDDVELTPGTAVLVESGSQDERTGTTCQRLLHDDLDRPHPSVLLVRYQQMDPNELREIATEAARLKLVSVGYAQDVPASLDDTVETVKITNPNDITRLGIVVSGTIDQWSDADGGVSFCYDSINVLLNYREVKRTFRFLHVLLKTLRRGDAVSHFHVDPLAGDPQSINTLKPLFDEIISIDSMGMTVE